MKMQAEACELVLHCTGNVLTPIDAALVLLGPRSSSAQEVVVMIRTALPRLWAMRCAVAAAVRDDRLSFDWWARRVDPQHLTDAERAEAPPIADAAATELFNDDKSEAHAESLRRGGHHE